MPTSSSEPPDGSVGRQPEIIALIQQLAFSPCLRASVVKSLARRPLYAVANWGLILLLAGCSTLERLHIAETPISDLTPIADMSLTRLIFTPSRITRGMDQARGMESIREIGLELESKMTPYEFWSSYDADEFK